MKNKFWPFNGEAAFHKVTHRHDKSIPGMTEAPFGSIYQPVALEVAQAMNVSRAERFAIALNNDQFGQSFRGNHFAEPIFGAYGEKL